MRTYPLILKRARPAHAATLRPRKRARLEGVEESLTEAYYVSRERADKSRAELKAVYEKLREQVKTIDHQRRHITEQAATIDKQKLDIYDLAANRPKKSSGSASASAERSARLFERAQSKIKIECLQSQLIREGAEMGNRIAWLERALSKERAARQMAEKNNARMKSENERLSVMGSIENVGKCMPLGGLDLFEAEPVSFDWCD